MKNLFTRWLNIGLILLFLWTAASCRPTIQSAAPQGLSTDPSVQTDSISNLPSEGRASLAREMGKHSPDLFFKSENSVYTAVSGELTLKVTGNGFLLQGKQGNWGMGLVEWGDGKTNQALQGSRFTADANRLSLQRGPLEEWFANTSLGLEHGFTISAPPVGKALSDPLTLVMEQLGDLSAVVEENRLGLAVGRSGEAAVYQYDGLMAFDSNGKSLKTWFEMENDRVLVRVEDQTAVYPVTVDPWAHCARLVSTDLQAYDEFSKSIAISGNTVVVGAPRYDRGGGTYTGQVYVFQKPEQGWSNLTEVAVLLPSDWSPNRGSFGDDVAIWENTIFVLDTGALFNGPAYFSAVYVYVRPNTGWADMTQTARLSFSYDTSDFQAIFGTWLAVNEEAVFVGVPGYHVPHTPWTETQGAVYVFVKPLISNGWGNSSETLILTSPEWASGIVDGKEKMHFGTSGAVTKDTLVIGAPDYYSQDPQFETTFPGIVYVYDRPTSGWSGLGVPDAHLTPSDGMINRKLGYSVDIQGDTIAASADIWEENLAWDWWVTTNRTRVLTFARPNGGWVNKTESASLDQSDSTPNDWFGSSTKNVRVFGDMVAVGCPYCTNLDGLTRSGAVYVFSKPAVGWDLGPDVINETVKLTSQEPKAYGYFGSNLLIQDDTILASQFSQGDVDADGRGAVYVLAPGFLRAVNDGPTQVGNPTHFRAQGSLGGGVTAYTWNFGDGTSQIGNVVTHTYTVAGKYSVSVQATNGTDTWIASTTVEVTTAPVPGWTSGGDPGFGSAGNQVISGLGVYNQDLYAGTTNGSGAQLWKESTSAKSRTAAGWTSMISPGFGNTNNTGINHLFVYGNKLYAGTVNEAQGGEIWLTRGYGTWEKVISGGFTDATNGEITRFEGFNNQLYAATWSYSSAHGAELWRSTNGIDTWMSAASNGFGDTHNEAMIALAQFNGNLYAGTVNYATGGEIWRSANGSNWTQVNQDGFGSADQPVVSSLAAFNGWMYASMYGYQGRALQVWRCQVCGGSDWQMVADAGFGNDATRGMNGLAVVGETLYLAVGNSITGMEVWYSTDGVTWNLAAFNGFGDAHNVAPYWGNSVSAVGNRLWVGTWNATTGGQLWQGATVVTTSGGDKLFMPLVQK